ncbi:thiamine pyrophosphate-dependent enzyme [Virgibacillus sp. W0181]|uniref:thiamine pyrophosphate-dependent enzyme n=1 Tax=Virgibacillus sp. W0181 TaxID=3391581 RepID=UPI003F46FA4D
MQKLSGGHTVVKVLETEGVKKAFCVPGESYLGVIDGLYKHPEIQLISTRHESGASFMAEAYAKASGDVGVCMATRGPGATNLSIGLHTAMQDSTPLVALIGQVERPFIDKEAFQEVDFKSYFSHLCKWSVEINDVDRIPELLHRAFYEARSGRPGPVVVSLPHDMLEEMTTYKQNKPIVFNRPIADLQTVQRVVDEINNAESPFVIAGGGVIISQAQKELERFVEQLNLPVASAFRRFNVLSNLHKNYAGWLGFGLNKKMAESIKNADLIIAIGTRLSQVTTQDYTLLGESPRIIQIDICESSIGKAYNVEFGVVSDAKSFLQSAISVINENENIEREKRVNENNDRYIKHSTPPGFKGDTQYAEMNSIMDDMMSAVPENSIITSDAGNFYGWLAKYFRFTDSKRYIGPTSGAMGYGLPSAIGAKVAHPDHTVISFSGDGGFMMTMQELETAVRERIHVISIVINNNMYGTIRAHQENHFPGRVLATPLTNPSFSEVAKLYGCNGATVSKNEDFLPVFYEALRSDKPYVIELETDPGILSVNQVGD